jgi:hypothetical protein
MSLPRVSSSDSWPVRGVADVVEGTNPKCATYAIERERLKRTQSSTLNPSRKHSYFQASSVGSEPKPLSLSASQLWFVIGPCRWLPLLSRDRPQPPFLPRDVRFQQHDQRRSLRLGHVYRRAPRHTPRELRERFREHVLQMSLSQLSLLHPDAIHGVSTRIGPLRMLFRNWIFSHARSAPT